MAKDLTLYKNVIDEAFKYYKLPPLAQHHGLALHSITYDETKKCFGYQCIEANQLFLSMITQENTPLENIRYAEIFPQNKENKFDWGAMLGHVASFESLTKFYCFSETTSKWYKFVALSPEKGLALLVAEDITAEKEKEIAQNISKYGNSTEK